MADLYIGSMLTINRIKELFEGSRIEKLETMFSEFPNEHPKFKVVGNWPEDGRIKLEGGLGDIFIAIGLQPKNGTNFVA